MIATVGVYVSFFFQAVTQWAVVAAVILMKPAPGEPNPRADARADHRSFSRFVITHAVLRVGRRALLVTCLCVRPYTWLLASFAHNVMHVDAKAYGIMLAMGGFGTIAGAFTTAIFQSERRGRFGSSRALSRDSAWSRSRWSTACGWCAACS